LIGLILGIAAATCYFLARKAKIREAEVVDEEEREFAFREPDDGYLM
jgi:hypothetical protein